MTYIPEIVLEIVKVRLNRLASDTTMDEHLTSRIKAADEEIARKGITLDVESIADQMLLADFVVWQYQNRDKEGCMPDWLNLRIRERWMNQRNVTG
jgi:hypothetical protein